MSLPSQPAEKPVPNGLGYTDYSFRSLVGATLDRPIEDTYSRNWPSAAQLNGLSPISLAYIGDAVFELYVRSRLLVPAKRIRDYHQQVVSQVKAEQQSEFVDRLAPHLTPDEEDILRRGRNATTGRSRRATAQHYQKATGFEALIGYLYLSDGERILSLLALLNIES